MGKLEENQKQLLGRKGGVCSGKTPCLIVRLLLQLPELLLLLLQLARDECNNEGGGGGRGRAWRPTLVEEGGVIGGKRWFGNQSD